jgi:hypothetical protein
MAAVVPGYSWSRPPPSTMASVCREYLSHCEAGGVLTAMVTSSSPSLVVMVSSHYLILVYSSELFDLQPLVFVSKFEYIVDSLFTTYCKVLAKETYVHCITFPSSLMPNWFDNKVRR